MSRIRIILLFSFWAAAEGGFLLQAQVQQNWVRILDDGPDDAAVGLSMDAAGNSYVLGQTFRAGIGFGLTTIKYAPDGTQLWLARHARSSNSFAQAITIDPSGNVYVSGATQGEG